MASVELLLLGFHLSPPALTSLHRLAVKQRVDFFEKLLIAFKSANGLAPSYTVDMLTEYTQDRTASSREYIF